MGEQSCQAHHLSKITRVPYSLNGDMGLVCLPIKPGGLGRFRPWQANLNLVEIREPWTQRCTELDLARVEAFVTALKTPEPGQTPVAGGERRAFFPPSRELAPSHRPDSRRSLRGDGEVGRAWRLLADGEPIPEERLLSGLQSADADVRWLTVEAFFLHGANLAKSGMTALLEQGEEYVRPAAYENAAEFLRELRDQRCVPYFAEVPRTTTHWRGAFIALELGKIGTPKAVADLVEGLSSSSQHVRRGSVRGLAEATDQSSIRPLIQCLLHDPGSKGRALAVTALVEMGGEAGAQLVEVWREEGIQGKQRRNAAKHVLQKLAMELPTDLEGTKE